MINPTVVEFGNKDSIVITKNGKVVGFVKLKKEYEKNVELVAYPVAFHKWGFNQEEWVYNSFATTMAIQVDTPSDIASADNFINMMNEEVA